MPTLCEASTFGGGATHKASILKGYAPQTGTSSLLRCSIQIAALTSAISILIGLHPIRNVSIPYCDPPNGRQTAPMWVTGIWEATLPRHVNICAHKR